MVKYYSKDFRALVDWAVKRQTDALKEEIKNAANQGVTIEIYLDPRVVPMGMNVFKYLDPNAKPNLSIVKDEDENE